MPAAILIADAGTGRIIMGNREAAALLGRDSMPLLDDTDWNAAYSALKASHADGRPYTAQDWPLFRSLIRGEAVREEEIAYVRPEGGRAVVAASSAPVRDSNGKIVAAVGTFADISARKREEGDLRVREERYRALLDGAQDYALILTAANGEIEAWSAGAQRIFRFPAEKVLGRKWTVLFGSEGSAATRADGLLRAALEKGFVVESVVFQDADGSTLNAEISIARLRPSGALRGFLVIVREP